ncbi:LytTR family DNA-binding domain-containing protein [Phenylobacterium sp.]|uniref:LytTR family DNA-binding domain-containing protein n=1 Tax=Phenylobacterium sp. TaxID=1871053 RepID=UPI0025F001EB|nr:LytTR family DNA-binding domain-containing protein [Phenylobacterium sp.]MBX3484757.1 LytTR family transcriptional regulator [Phenylobacterium sp.]
MSSDASAGGARRRDRLFLGVFMLVAAAIAVVDAFSVTDDRAKAGRPIGLWEPLVWETSSVLALLALAPLVMALTRRMQPLVAPWPRVLAVHLGAAVAFSLVHVTVMGAVRWAVYAALGGFYSALGPLRDFPYEFRKDLLIYLGVVAIYATWLRAWPGPPPAEAAGGDPAAIEVRDGARRHFVPLTEVAFIEAAGNYVELHRGPTPILHRAPLSSMERQLAGAGFVRIHRSRLVRRAAISEVESKPSGDFVVRLADGRELMGSRRYRKPLLDPA